MADNRRYYYMRLNENYFDSNEQIVLESMPDGYLYSNILLKLYLKSLNSSGKLMLNEFMPYSPEMIARMVRHDLATVQRALKVFSQLGLIEVLTDDVIYMRSVENFVGSSSTEADRIRGQRRAAAEQKALASGSFVRTNVQPLPEQMNDKTTPDIRDKSIDIRDKENKDIYINNNNIYTPPAASAGGHLSEDKPAESRHKYGEYTNVLMTEAELKKLQQQFPVDWQRRIDDLSLYLKSHKTNYKNHYFVILSWARKDGVRGKPAAVQSQFYMPETPKDCIPNFVDFLEEG